MDQRMQARQQMSVDRLMALHECISRARARTVGARVRVWFLSGN